MGRSRELTHQFRHRFLLVRTYCQKEVKLLELRFWGNWRIGAAGSQLFPRFRVEFKLPVEFLPHSQNENPRPQTSSPSAVWRVRAEERLLSRYTTCWRLEQQPGRVQQPERGAGSSSSGPCPLEGLREFSSWNCVQNPCTVSQRCSTCFSFEL